ncbi:lipid kinase [Pantanalinema sp. GBBB05]|uniref:lipid kinase n=1 Tax=Pantanalinema sp. GBBB05 TaxID=2604139 RepID=UPI001D751D28|nr:lipid kinase [Pantanalinema sp. GBBB05]
MGKALLVVNSRARQAQQKLADAIAQLHACGLEWIKVAPPQASEISDAIRHHQSQVDRVVIAGGDGTLNAAIPGLLDTQLPLGILPLGTANDLARTLGIPTDLAAACKILTAGQLERIDLGQVNDRYFFNVASIGLSVQITRKLNRETKQQWGILAYPIAALQALNRSRPFWATVSRDNGQSQRMRTIQIAVGNGRYYGGGMTVTADATINSQQLDVYSLNLQHWWQLLAILPAMRSGDHTSWSFVEDFQAQTITVETARPMPINTDGEITTYTPARFQVLPQAISVFCSQEANLIADHSAQSVVT